MNFYQREDKNVLALLHNYFINNDFFKSMLRQFSFEDQLNFVSQIKLGKYNANQIICEQGDVGEEMYYIISGSVGIFIQNKHFYDRLPSNGFYSESHMTQQKKNFIKEKLRKTTFFNKKMLNQLPLFNLWKRQGLEIILNHCQEYVTYSTGQTIYKEQDLVKFIYIIKEGEVQIFEQKQEIQNKKKSKQILKNIQNNDNEQLHQIHIEEQEFYHDYENIQKIIKNQYNLPLQKQKKQQKWYSLSVLCGFQTFGELEILPILEQLTNIINDFNTQQKQGNLVSILENYQLDFQQIKRKTRAICKTNVKVMKLDIEYFFYLFKQYGRRNNYPSYYKEVMLANKQEQEQIFERAEKQKKKINHNYELFNQKNKNEIVEIIKQDPTYLNQKEINRIPQFQDKQQAIYQSSLIQDKYINSQYKQLMNIQETSFESQQASLLKQQQQQQGSKNKIDCENPLILFKPDEFQIKQLQYQFKKAQNPKNKQFSSSQNSENLDTHNYFALNLKQKDSKSKISPLKDRNQSQKQLKQFSEDVKQIFNKQKEQQRQENKLQNISKTSLDKECLNESSQKEQNNNENDSYIKPIKIKKIKSSDSILLSESQHFQEQYNQDQIQKSPKLNENSNNSNCNQINNEYNQTEHINSAYNSSSAKKQIKQKQTSYQIYQQNSQQQKHFQSQLIQSNSNSNFKKSNFYNYNISFTKSLINTDPQKLKNAIKYDKYNHFRSQSDIQSIHIYKPEIKKQSQQNQKQQSNKTEYINIQYNDNSLSTQNQLEKIQNKYSSTKMCTLQNSKQTISTNYSHFKSLSNSQYQRPDIQQIQSQKKSLSNINPKIIQQNEKTNNQYLQNNHQIHQKLYNITQNDAKLKKNYVNNHTCVPEWKKNIFSQLNTDLSQNDDSQNQMQMAKSNSSQQFLQYQQQNQKQYQQSNQSDQTKKNDMDQNQQLQKIKQQTKYNDVIKEKSTQKPYKDLQSKDDTYNFIKRWQIHSLIIKAKYFKLTAE
ncbi:Cyclic nucleotide-binding protein [Pseudocohnilembus persalinus]|uniref:Cyclic nucleotide-binding protein n=1 Tax=Pseudocohnilembus persalinus TaxID=266149 RepID=A0A0V0QL57_PSEPJ|nr:Cyclic nucleotide-binding protein [Pseudocohnilembus persalinus]|eukprot:KRX03039.1 Cyclic nucleotide-binding protein [Pseudocohnilembus persalinus]